MSWPIRPQWFNTFSPCAEPFRDGHEGMWARFGSQGSIALNWHSRYSGTWLYIVNLILRNKLQWNLNQNSYIFMHENVLENIFWKMVAILSRPQHCSVPSICDLFCTLSVFVELALCACRLVSQLKLLGGNQWNFNDFVVSTAPADGLVPSSTLASKGTVMNKFGSCV